MQRIQVDEGAIASVHIGPSVPVVLRGARLGPGSRRDLRQEDDRIVFRDLVTGFTVRPSLSGDRVTLHLAPRRDLPSAQGPGAAEFQRAETTLTGRLGEWMEVAAVLAAPPSQWGEGASYSTRSVVSSPRRILVKVEATD